MKEKKITIGNLELFYFDSGNEGIPLLLIHGNSLHSGLFYKLFGSEKLQAYRIIAPDLPGHGKSAVSENPENDYSVMNYIQLLVTFVNNLNLQSPVIFGHSLGGHIGIHVASQLEDVRGLAVMGTPPLTAPPKLEEAFLPNQAIALAFKPDLTDDELHALSSAFMNEKHQDFGLVSSAIGSCDPLVRPFIGKSIATESTIDETVLVKNATCPVAIFHGEKDGLVNPAYLDALTPWIWKNQVQTIEHATHSAFLENPIKFIQVLENFIKTIQ